MHEDCELLGKPDSCLKPVEAILKPALVSALAL